MANTLLSNGFLWMTPTIALKFYPASRVPRDADTIAINAGVRKVTWPDAYSGSTPVRKRWERKKVHLGGLFMGGHLTNVPL
jgi:hypothetical protein